MATKTQKEAEKVVKQRNKYTADHKAKARKYYLMGLNMHDISTLLNGCPVRTLEKWQISEKWTIFKQTENIKVRALELHESGKNYAEIAELLQISRVTVGGISKKPDKPNPFKIALKSICQTLKIWNHEKSNHNHKPKGA